MIESQYTLAPKAGDPDTICLSQKPAAGGLQDLILNGSSVVSGISTLDIPRRVEIFSDGADTGRTFIIYGTNRNDTLISESLLGPGTSNLDYKTVTEITVDADTDGNITAGTNGVMSTQWVPVDFITTPFELGVFAILSSGASLTYSFEQTPLNILDAAFYSTPSNFIFDNDITAMHNATTSQNAKFDRPTRAVRLTTSVFASGTVTFMVKQGGL